MEKSITQQENELFCKWQKKYCIEESKFAKDGVVCPDEWEKVSKKVIFLLKETNGCDNLREHLKKGGRSNTWANVARWQYGIQNSNKEIRWKDVEDFGRNTDARKKHLRQICAINLKKQPGKEKTNRKELERVFFESNLKYFAEQVSIYKDAKYIICCSKDIKNILFRPEVFKECFDYDYISGKGIKYNDIWTYKLSGRDTHIVSFRHPCIYGDSEPLYKKLVRAIQELEMDN